MSRPCLSVPSQCSLVGDFSELARSCLAGSCVATIGAATTIITSNNNTKPLMTAKRFRKNGERQKLRLSVRRDGVGKVWSSIEYRFSLLVFRSSLRLLTRRTKNECRRTSSSRLKHDNPFHHLRIANTRINHGV
jgi:hypothetical protein